MKDFLKKEFGQRLKESRIRKFSGKVKQKHMALMLKIPIRTYQSYELGEAYPPDIVLRQIANILSVDPGWLHYGPKKKSGLSPELKALIAQRDAVNARK